jgi:hypothetical protein
MKEMGSNAQRSNVITGRPGVRIWSVLEATDRTPSNKRQVSALPGMMMGFESTRVNVRSWWKET